MPAASALGYSTGIATTSFPVASQGCNGCHSGGNTPIVSLEGPSSVEVGSVLEYTLVIVETGSQTQGGLNVSSDLGVLSLGGGDSLKTQLITGTGGREEVTHTNRKAGVAGEIRFSFEFTAPASAGDVTVAGWGNAVDGTFTSLGDLASLVEKTVSVNASPPPTAVPDLSSPWAQASLILLLLGAGTWLLRRRNTVIF